MRYLPSLHSTTCPAPKLLFCFSGAWTQSVSFSPCLLCLLFVCCITCCLKWSFRSFEAAVNCIVTDTAVQQINQRQWEVMRRLWCGEQRVLGV